MISIRPMRWWDIEIVADIEQTCFPHDTWSVEQFWQELAQHTRRYFVAVDGDDVIGYAGAFVLEPDSDVQTIAVSPHARGRGVGRRLLRELIHGAESGGATSMILEVRDDNDDALGLYRAFDFDIISRRRSYYPDGGDALILQRRPLRSGDLP